MRSTETHVAPHDGRGSGCRAGRVPTGSDSSGVVAGDRRTVSGRGHRAGFRGAVDLHRYLLGWRRYLAEAAELDRAAQAGA